MKIIDPSFEITYFQENAMETIESAGRICYMSAPNGDPESFIQKLMRSGHHTPLEMAHATVEIVCDRGISHELVRHRVASFNQSSTRYCNFSKNKFGNEITVIRPCFWDDDSVEFGNWEQSCLNAEHKYFKLLNLGATPQEARSVLPNSLKTNIVISANFREWLHIFNLRCSSKSHPQMVEIMLPLRYEFARRLPVIFGGLKNV